MGVNVPRTKPEKQTEWSLVNGGDGNTGSMKEKDVARGRNRGNIPSSVILQRNSRAGAIPSAIPLIPLTSPESDVDVSLLNSLVRANAMMSCTRIFEWRWQQSSQ